VGKAHELAEYFTEDAVLDVDGVVAKGHAEIAKLYTRPAGAQSPAAQAQYRRGNMLLTNPIINVQGDVATAHLIWTGVTNEGVGKPPGVYEQGREYTELRKVKGKWLISRRFISSDSGLPDRFDATWEPREHRCLFNDALRPKMPLGTDIVCRNGPLADCRFNIDSVGPEH